MQSNWQSRLKRAEQKKDIRKAIIYFVLTFSLIIIVILWGLPAFVKMVVLMGEVKNSSTPIESKDNIPPSPPLIKPLPEASNSEKLQIEGSAEPSSTVSIYLNGQPEGDVVTGNDGAFSFAGIILTREGNNEIYAIATDGGGNKSQPSDKVSIVYDKTAPKLEITQPAQNDQVSLSKKTVEIKGQTDPKTSITINDRIIIVNQSGAFSYAATLVEGENIFKIVATDAAGNKTEQELKLKAV